MGLATARIAHAGQVAQRDDLAARGVTGALGSAKPWPIGTQVAPSLLSWVISCVAVQRSKVRHAGPRAATGLPKAATMDYVIRQRAPWATVDWSPATWSPAEIRPLMEGRSLIVDAVGEEPFTAQLSRLAHLAGVPMVSIALYRGGFVARARLFAPGGVAIHERTDAERFRPIPAWPLEPTTTWETGCAAPINNAPPTSVVSAAALAAGVAVEFLTGRETGSADVVEVYRALDEPPFDSAGAQRFE